MKRNKIVGLTVAFVVGTAVGSFVTDYFKRPTHAYLALEFQAKNRDLDGDGIPDLVVRINDLWGNQLVPLYKTGKNSAYYLDKGCFLCPEKERYNAIEDKLNESKE